MKNIMITGPINIGKSTIIHAVIKRMHIDQNEITGFYTLPIIEEEKVTGFYMKGLNPNNDLSECIIGRKIEDQKAVGITKNFESFGVEILEYALKGKESYVIMDELGFLENEAYLFQKKVHEVLSSEKRVLGVIKPINTSFMNSIRKRKDVTLFKVTKFNREQIVREICSLLRK